MLSIIISTWNSIQYIRQCIESISALTIADVEIIVVDSNSSDGTREYLEALGDRVRIVCLGRRLTWSEANQIGLDIARGDWICLSNPDIIFNDGFSTMVAQCASKNIRIAVPLLVFPDGRFQGPARTITPWLSLCIHTRVIPLLLKKNKTDHVFPYDPYGAETPVDSPQGSLFVLHRSVLDRFGGHLWNRGYLNGVSDLDAFLNFRRQSIKIWLFPQHRIIHFGSYVSKRFPKWIERDQARGLVLYFRHWERAKGPILRGWFSPRLYSVLYAIEAIVTTYVEIAGTVFKHGNPFFTPKWTAWQAGERILGLIEGWRYKID